MHRSYAISFISEIKNQVSNYIESKLKSYGLDGLVVSHGSILTALYKNDGQLHMKDISDKISRSKSTVTQLVDKLIEAGYVKKEIADDDRRVHNIVLTEKGWSFQGYFKEISQEVNEVFFQNFSELEQEMFLKMLLKVKDNFEK